MSGTPRVVVAGVVSVRVALRVPSFPVPFMASRRDNGGIGLRLASTAWTAARTLQRLGTTVSLATYVGADMAGQLASHGLRKYGLYGPATLVCPTQPSVVVLYDHDGHRSSTRDHGFTAESRYPPEVLTSILDTLEHCDLALLTSVGFTRSLIPVVAERGIPIATDLQLVTDIDSSPYQDRMRSAHILACSHERLTGTPESWIVELWRRFGVEVALVGCGPGGAVLGVRTGHRIWRIDAITPRGVRYTSGAGDTLLASFVHHYLTGCHPLGAARHAVLAAGWKVGGEPAEEPGLTAADLAEIRGRHGLPAIHRLR
ncbi:carbohydrate kinase family protein [Actinophytocola sp.]|uniref:carbohydrate kinase family protein n=1 Tax=Actinophytocola sp. TaxID=1872138 RepID=UPI002DDCDDA4|nr:carbohydrate kinase family protein [Actinophytocola sp.]